MDIQSGINNKIDEAVGTNKPGFSFERLTQVNVTRCSRWHKGGIEEWSPEKWFLATLGELGETANAMKKLWRIESNMANISEPERQLNTREDALIVIGSEIADSAIYMNLFATRIGISLKFDPQPITKLDADRCLALASIHLHKAVEGHFYHSETISVTASHLQKSMDSLRYLAAKLGINFAEAVSNKFNATSEKYGFPERI